MLNKEEFDRLMERCSHLEKEAVRLEERKKQAQAELEKVDAEIVSLAKGNPVEPLLEKLEKELETRIEMLSEKVSEFERMLEDLKIKEDSDGY